MLGQQFYHETMRNVIVAFGTLFNNIHMVRKNNSGTIVQTMKVPLAYGPRQKWLQRIDQDPSQDTKVAIRDSKPVLRHLSKIKSCTKI
jgi:hypothetical protein